MLVVRLGASNGNRRHPLRFSIPFMWICCVRATTKDTKLGFSLKYYVTARFSNKVEAQRGIPTRRFQPTKCICYVTLRNASITVHSTCSLNEFAASLAANLNFKYHKHLRKKIDTLVYAGCLINFSVPSCVRCTARH